MAPVHGQMLEIRAALWSSVRFVLRVSLPLSALCSICLSSASGIIYPSSSSSISLTPPPPPSPGMCVLFLSHWHSRPCPTNRRAWERRTRSSATGRKRRRLTPAQHRAITKNERLFVPLQAVRKLAIRVCIHDTASLAKSSAKP